MKPKLLPSPSQRSGIIVLTNEPAKISAAATPAETSAITPSVVDIVAIAVATACSTISAAYTGRVCSDEAPTVPARDSRQPPFRGTPRCSGRGHSAHARGDTSAAAVRARASSRLARHDSVSRVRRGEPAEVQAVRLLRCAAVRYAGIARARGAQDGDD